MEHLPGSGQPSAGGKVPNGANCGQSGIPKISMTRKDIFKTEHIKY